MGCDAMSLTFKEADQILRIIEEFPAGEVRFEYGDLKIHVRRTGSPASRRDPVPSDSLPASAPARAADDAATRAAPAATDAKPQAPAPVLQEGFVSVASPLMGVFYEAPSPGAEPFVKAGQHVTAGDDLCIIEVMKIMNAIKAPCTGVVVEIGVVNGQTVASGEALMWIRPEGTAP